MMAFRALLLMAAMVQICSSANLAISTYFKDGFTPAAIANDTQGNVLIAGSAVIDPASGSTGVAVAKLDPKASQYLYLTYLDSAASDQVSAIAVDGAGNTYIAGWTTNPNFPVAGGGLLGTPPTSSQDEEQWRFRNVAASLIARRATWSVPGIVKKPWIVPAYRLAATPNLSA